MWDSGADAGRLRRFVSSFFLVGDLNAEVRIAADILNQFHLLFEILVIMELRSSFEFTFAAQFLAASTLPSVLNILSTRTSIEASLAGPC